MTHTQLQHTQSRLLDVGSAVATPVDTSSSIKIQRTAFPAAHTSQLEEWIDTMDAELPPLKNFILPSGVCMCVWGDVFWGGCVRGVCWGVCSW